MAPSSLPLVSVVMPNYNKGKYLRSAIESILSQTYSNLELVIVDDGSTDDSLDIIREYSDKDPRLAYKKQTHRGISTACNAAIENAKGDFIARQDSDDICSKERVAKQVVALAGAPPSVCYSDGWMIDESGMTTGEVYNRNHVNLPKAGHEGDIFRRLIRGSFILNASIMAHRECFKLVKYDARYQVAEDWDLSVRLARHFQFRYIPEPLYGYRIHAGNTANPGNDDPTKTSRMLRSEVTIQKNWLKEFELEPSDRKSIIRQIIRTEYSINDYMGLLQVGLSNTTALRVLLRETLRSMVSAST